MRRSLVFIAVMALVILLGTGGAFAIAVGIADPPSMNDYCAVPPYVIQNVPPNVMLLLDNSKSMLKFAYAEEECPNRFTKTFSYHTATSSPSDPQGLSMGDWFYFGNKTDTLYFSGGSLSEYSVGDYVYMLVYDFKYWDCSSGDSGDNWRDSCLHYRDDLGRPTYARYYWRGVADGDRLKIGSIVNWDSSARAQVATIVDGEGNPLTEENKLDEYTTILLIKASCSTVDNRIFSGHNSYRDWTVKDSGFDPSRVYYGYFSPNHWYTYEANTRFRPADPREGSGLEGARAKDADEWDGNFLNWLTMRRVDVMRKALTGGKTASAQANQTIKRIAEPVDSNVHHGVYKWVDNAQDYIDTTRYYGEGPRCFYFPSGVGTASFRVDQNIDANCSTDAMDERDLFDPADDAPLGSSSYDSYDYNLNAIETLPGEIVEGVLQKVVGARARIGLTWFDSNSAGGDVVTDMDGQALESVINDINISTPNTETPLAEALWTVTGYFASMKGYSSGRFDNTVRSTGPYYTSSYGVTANEDPMNFSTGGQARYPECAKNFVLLLTDGNPCLDGSLPNFIKNFAKSGADRSDFNCGAPYSDWKCPAESGSGYAFPEEWIFDASTYYVKPWAECPWGAAGNVAGLEDVALFSHITDLRDNENVPDSDSIGTDTGKRMDGMQNLNLYIVNMFGSGSTLMSYAAINGGFNEENSENPNGRPDEQIEWDADSNGRPDNLYLAEDGAQLEEAVEEAFSSMLKRASSGTAASVLASGEDTGANLIQAIFYPRRRFGNEVIRWTGSLQSFWYYLDPFLKYTTIREDTDGDNVLDKTGDRIVSLYFDEETQTARADRFTSNASGAATSNVDTVAIEELNFLWEAGAELFERDISTDPRTIFMPDVLEGGPYIVNGTLRNEGLPADGLIALVNDTAYYPGIYNGFMGTADADEAERVIRYLHGTDVFVDDGHGRNLYRDRTVTVPAISNIPAVWKLADILNSTPKIASAVPLMGYYKWYRDETYRKFYSDVAHDADGIAADSSRRYKNRGTVFAGANDGMLHAFRLGKVEHDWEGQQQLEVARLTGSDLGKEEWAFVPINALPYLKYYPLRDYCHVYTVDLSPQIFDVAIVADMGYDEDGDGTADQPTECTEENYYNCLKSERSWRTVLIGGMRYGGACRNRGSGTTEGVETPLDGVGFSSYFALDITDPVNPTFMWEFTDPGLGFTTPGPLVVKINGEKDTNGDSSVDTPSKDANGKWFVVLANGPTGPINTAGRQFMGHSDENLKLYVLDLRTGETLRVIDEWPNDVKANAFAGSLYGNVHDLDRRPSDYSDDVIYFGYTQKDDTTGTWTKGGVMRVVTREDMDPDNWKPSEFISGTGPVTSAVSVLAEVNKQDADRVWVYFGSGRYFYDLDDDHDDYLSRRYLYGVVDECMSAADLTAMNIPPADTFDDPCPASANITVVEGDGTDTVPPAGSGLLDNTENNLTQDDTDGTKGWRIALFDDGTYAMPKADGSTEDIAFAAERVITDPLADATTNIVYFTTLMPYDTDCGLGGRTFIWAVDGRTGGDALDRLKGKALVQVSTGVIEEVDFAEVFTDDGQPDDGGTGRHRGGRRSSAMEGVPPTAQGMSLHVAPPPRDRVVHIIEK